MHTAERPHHLDLQRDKGLAVEWSDGRRSFFPIALLRRMSPSAEQRELRAEMERNPLTVLPASAAGSGAPLRAEGAELVGNYAIRIQFSDGHDTGIYTWSYLRSLDPQGSGEAGSVGAGSVEAGSSVSPPSADRSPAPGAEPPA